MRAKRSSSRSAPFFAAVLEQTGLEANDLRRVLAIELLTAARAIDLRAPLTPSAGSAAAIAVLRESVDGPGPDRFLAPDIAEAEARLADGTLLAAVEGVVGDLR